MTYEKFIKKYEGKRRSVVFISCFFFLMFIAAVIAAAVFIPGFIAKGGPSVPTLLIVLPVGAVIILIGFLLLTLSVFREFMSIKQVRADMEKIQQQTGLTDNDMFMEVINSSRKFSGLPDVYISDSFIIDLGSWFGLHTDSITGLEKDYSFDDTGDTSCTNYFVVIAHDGKKSRIYASSEALQKKLYDHIYDLWQGSAGINN